METKVAQFEYVICPNETLYKGMNTSVFDNSYQDISWFSKNEKTAQKYGNYVHKVLTTRPLKLVNIMSTQFHTFLQDKLMDMFSNDSFEGTYDTRMKILAPLGLPDLETQTRFLSRLFPSIRNKTSEEFKVFGAFVGHKSRFSSKELDKGLISLIRNLLQQYSFDGYIAPSSWPSQFHGLFHDEVCLFNPKQCNLLYAHNSLVIKQSGGTLYYGQFDSGKAIDDNAIDISVMRTLGYDGPIQYDDNGKVIILGYEWIQDYKRQKNLKQLENVVIVASKKKTPKR